MDSARNAFAIVRLVLTAVAGALLALALLLIGYAVVVEGDRFDGAGANIGLGLLLLALIINAPVWALWLVPPYPWSGRKR